MNNAKWLAMNIQVYLLSYEFIDLTIDLLMCQSIDMYVYIYTSIYWLIKQLNYSSFIDVYIDLSNIYCLSLICLLIY